MDTDQNKQPAQPHVSSVPVGGPEGDRARVETGQVSEYVRPSEPEPKISEEVVNAGVAPVRDQPMVPPVAKNAGLKPSIPEEPNYNIAQVDIKVGEEMIEKADTADANAWRTLLSIFKEKKDRFMSLFKPKPIQQNPV